MAALDDSDAREGELAFQTNAQATWRAGVVAALVAGVLVPMWLIAVDRLAPLRWGLFPPQDHGKIVWIALAAAAIACGVALRVARMRQPRGARVGWDRWGISEWDGDGVRVAIPWSEATVAEHCDAGEDGIVVGLTLRIQGAHGREIWVTQGVQSPALAGRLTSVQDLGPLLAATRGVRKVPIGDGYRRENLLALFYITAIGGYVCATLGLGVLLMKHTVPTYVPHFLGGSAGLLALRALLPLVQRRRLGAEERRLRGARRVQLVGNDGPLLTAQDDTGRRHVVDTRTLAHPDGRLQERRGEAFAVLDAAGAVVAVETAALRGARRTYRRALALEAVLRASLVIPVCAALSLFHARDPADRAWTVIDGPYDAHDTPGSLLADGSRALIATHTSYGNDVALFDLSTSDKPELGSLDLGSSNNVEVLALAPDRTRAVVSRGYDALVWEVGERKAEARGSLAASEGIVAVAFSRDGELLLTGGTDGAVSVWDTTGFERRHTFTGHIGEVVTLACSPDGALAVSGGADGTARLLDLARATPGAVLTGHDGRVQVVAFLGQTVVTGAADGAVRFFSAEGALERTVAAHRGGVTAIGLHSGGAFATAGDDRLIRVWAADWRSERSEELGLIDLDTDERVRDAGRITGVAFSSARNDLLVLTSHGMLLRVDLTRL